MREILFANADYTIVLLDLPASVEQAAALGDKLRLVSSKPFTEPYPSCRPRSEKAKANLEKKASDIDQRAEISQLVQNALEYARAHRPATPFCLPRLVTETNKNEDLKRKADYENYEIPFIDLIREGGTYKDRSLLDYSSSNLLKSQEHRKQQTISQDFSRNDSDEPQTYYLIAQQRFSFHVPPSSAFLLSRCEDNRAFERAIKAYSPGPQPGVSRCNLIILDPPWPNSSASRKASYEQTINLQDMRDLLLGMNLGDHMEPGGFMAIWITGRAAIRDLVLGKMGLFDFWNIQLEEEWVWTKVTESGDPIIALDSAWRRPHEYLLVGKTPVDPKTFVDTMADQVKRRVIFAVPDVHSRKPCLKTMFEKTLLKSVDEPHKVLEVFARHLVKGWMSWGDEVIKFNGIGHWECSEDEDHGERVINTTGGHN